MAVTRQLSLFLQNEAGSLNKACQVLAQNNINIITLSLADTREYGILRLLVQDQSKAQELLTQAGFVVKDTPVLVVPVADQPGGLAAILAALNQENINVLYMYAFPSGKDGKALMVFRFEEPEKALSVLENAGFATLEAGDF
ncbi:MAG: ACT domain-containing protein [Lentisphaeria bacterium]|nr:ACT domain-containing protein [Lentisphaeria bacterium]